MEKNVEDELWGKTLISIYKFLPDIADAVDNIVKKKTINSLFYNAYEQLSTYELSNKIIELTERKIKIINLKVLTETALNNLTVNDQKILILYYVDGVKYQEILDLLNISARTFFRKKCNAIKNFSKELKFLGFNGEKLNDYLKSESWIINTYFQIKNIYLNRQKNSENIVSYKLLKSAIKEFNNPFSVNYKFSS